MGFSITSETSKTKSLSCAEIVQKVIKANKAIKETKTAPSIQPRGITMAEAKAFRKSMEDELSKMKLQRLQNREAKELRAYHAQIKANKTALQAEARKLKKQHMASRYQSDFSGMLKF